MTKLSQACALLVVFGSGCFVLSDTDRFEQDTSCDLQLRLRNFAPHTDDLFTVALMQRTPTGNELLTTAIFEPLEDATMNLRMPLGVPPLPTPDRELARIQFFGDDDSMPGFSGGDHSWVLADACASGPEVFLHDILFDPLVPPPDAEELLVVPEPPAGEEPQLTFAKPDVLTVSLCNVPRGAPIEVRVYGDLFVEGGVEERRATGLYRFTQNPRGDITRTLRLPSIVDRGFDHFIDVYIDANGNGAFDDGETAWSFTFQPEPNTPSCDLNGALPGGTPDPCADIMLPPMFREFPACTEDDETRITLGPLADNNRVDSILNFTPDADNSWINFDANDVEN